MNIIETQPTIHTKTSSQTTEDVPPALYKELKEQIQNKYSLTDSQTQLLINNAINKWENLYKMNPDKLKHIIGKETITKTDLYIFLLENNRNIFY